MPDAAREDGTAASNEPEVGLKGLLLSQVKSMARGARSRARKAGLAAESGLTALAVELFLTQHGRCALTGLPFHLQKIGTGAARRPFAPSLDRIDCEQGYTRDNVRLVCQAVNFALNSFGEDVFYEIAKAAVIQVGKVPKAISDRDTIDEAERKRRYIDFVIEHAPDLLRQRGGAVCKAKLREALRQLYPAALPSDEANAYGWAFRRLTEAGIIHPASNSRNYELRCNLAGQGWSGG